MIQQTGQMIVHWCQQTERECWELEQRRKSKPGREQDTILIALVPKLAFSVTDHYTYNLSSTSLRSPRPHSLKPIILVFHPFYCKYQGQILQGLIFLLLLRIPEWLQGGGVYFRHYLSGWDRTPGLSTWRQYAPFLKKQPSEELYCLPSRWILLLGYGGDTGEIIRYCKSRRAPLGCHMQAIKSIFINFRYFCSLLHQQSHRSHIPTEHGIMQRSISIPITLIDPILSIISYFLSFESYYQILEEVRVITRSNVKKGTVVDISKLNDLVEMLLQKGFYLRIVGGMTSRLEDPVQHLIFQSWVSIVFFILEFLMSIIKSVRISMSISDHLAIWAVLLALRSILLIYFLFFLRS